MKKTLIIFLYLCLAFGSSPLLLSQSDGFKVIGYLPYYRFSSTESIALDKLTHLNLAFANPDMEGNLSIADRDITPIVSAAHAEQVKVLISLAGGALTAEWAAAWNHLMKPENRSDYIHKILEYVASHNLDGIDVDLEWQYVTELYSGFVLELRDSVDQYPDLLLTAALPGTYRYPQISDAAMHAYDFINMMVYDLRGPWDPTNVGPHSPYSFAESSISYWEGQGMQGENLTLGVPFYGYDFSNAPQSVSSFTYQSMVNLDPANAELDQVGESYYNGIPTIQQKTDLALSKLSGIMIWELGQDHFGEYSLLSAIDQVIQGQTSTEVFARNLQFKAFPNPIVNELQLRNESPLVAKWRLMTMDGKEMQSGTILGNTDALVSCEQLLGGMYLLQFVTGNQWVNFKLIKS